MMAFAKPTTQGRWWYRAHPSGKWIPVQICVEHIDNLGRLSNHLVAYFMFMGTSMKQGVVTMDGEWGGKLFEPDGNQRAPTTDDPRKPSPRISEDLRLEVAELREDLRLTKARLLRARRDISRVSLDAFKEPTPDQPRALVTAATAVYESWKGSRRLGAGAKLNADLMNLGVVLKNIGALGPVPNMKRKRNRRSAVRAISGGSQ